MQPFADAAYVALLAPEALDGLDYKAIADALGDAFVRVHRHGYDLRALVSIATPPDGAGRTALLAIKGALAERMIAAQWLLGPGVDEAFAGPGVIARMPDSAEEPDQRAFALGLCDCVVAGPAGGRLLADARRLAKPVFPPGADLPSLAVSARPVLALDPGERFFGRAWRHVAGRFEGFWTNLLSFDPTRPSSWRRYLAGFAPRGDWRPASDFPTDATRPYALDEAAKADAPGPARRVYAAFDRAAIYGARVHRDVIWAICVFTALAVIFAGIGKLTSEGADAISGWSLFGQFFTLFGVLVLLPLVWSLRLRGRWIAARVGAEDLRLAQILVPMMIAPPQWTLPDLAPGELAKPGLRTPPDYRQMAVQGVVRALRSQGLPRLSAGATDETRAAWLAAHLEEQIRYHERNETRLHRAEHNALRMTLGISAFALTAPLAESIVKYREVLTAHGFPAVIVGGVQSWLQASTWQLLLLTALPAVAAAFHAATTRMGFATRAQLSQRVGAALDEIKAQLDNSPEMPWPRLRPLALAAVRAMEDENQSWHNSLVRARDMPPM